MMADNVELFRQVIERGFNQGDLSVADEICADKFAEHQYLLPTDLPGPEILKIEIQSSRESLEGLHLTIEDIVADGDKVWARMVASGTDRMSRKTVTATVMDVCRFNADGRMVEHRGVPDRFAVLHQLGRLRPIALVTHAVIRTYDQRSATRSPTCRWLPNLLLA